MCRILREGIEEKAGGARLTKPPEPFTLRQVEIMKVLHPDHREAYKMTADVTTHRAGMDRRTFFKEVAGLMKAGKVANKPGVGYYLPDAPPNERTV